MLLLHVVSDSIIALAYYSIPIALIFFVRQRRDLAFSWIFVLFAVFIVACGTTHVLGIWTIWYPAYWLDGMVKALTATVSLITAILLWPLIPKALALPSPAQLRSAYLELEERNRLIEKASRMKSEFLANMDLGLPGISGVEATERIKANPAIKDIPIVINTAFNATDLTRRALAAGAAEILHKPIELMVLRDTLHKYLSKESSASESVVDRIESKFVECER